MKAHETIRRGARKRISPSAPPAGRAVGPVRENPLQVWQRGVGNQTVGRQQAARVAYAGAPAFFARAAGNRSLAVLSGQGLLAKLVVNRPGDRWEREADRVADRITSGEAAYPAPGPAAPPGVQRRCKDCKEEKSGTPPTVQRRCRECQEEEKAEQVQAKERPGRLPRPGPGIAGGIRSLGGAGEPLAAATRSFFEGHFGRDLSAVRIHRDARAAELASAIGARAFTVGGDVAFAAGEFAPGTRAGRHLLAHELTHVVQQGGGGSLGATGTSTAAAPPRVQREVHRGHDHGGSYELDDADCTLTYRQHWYFTFRDTGQTEEERRAYMGSARSQIEGVWSEKFPLIPETRECACHPAGIRVLVRVTTSEGERSGRGFSITVTRTELRGFTDPATRQIGLGTSHETPLYLGPGLTQQRVAHEFGHTIDLTDEYNTWADLFFPTGARDEPSIMHSGDEVRPRHYQHFADLVNLELGPPCTYWPGGVRQPAFANPVERFSGIPFTFQPDRADFVLGLQYDRRISNDPLLGLFYPTVGAMTLWDPDRRSVALGPTAGLRLSQIAHPLFVDVRTGVLFDPSAPERRVGVSIPLALEVGLRTEGFEIGANYTPIVNVLGQGGWTHLIGVGGRFDLPWERRRR